MFNKMLLGPLLAVMLLGAGFSAWMTTADAEPARGEGLPRSVVMEVGDKVVLDDGSVLTFVELVEDSRCPMDAMCIWQGQAVLAFELDGKPFQVTFDEAGDSGSAGIYRVVVEDVQPYPMASQPADPADAEVTVTVTK